jgi:hypothetical protein
VLPAPGLVLAFAHGLWHEGERLQQGVKWCCRTDVMYRRVSAEAAEAAEAEAAAEAQAAARVAEWASARREEDAAAATTGQAAAVAAAIAQEEVDDWGGEWQPAPAPRPPAPVVDSEAARLFEAALWELCGEEGAEGAEDGARLAALQLDATDKLSLEEQAILHTATTDRSSMMRNL